jgi:MazG family protein
MTTPGRPAIEELLAIMARLRDPARGCPWDIEQRFETIAPHTIEEAYEVADAIEQHDFPQLRDELGDLLFQVVFHAQMAREAGHFDFEDVARSICDKMQRRHPHVFGEAKIADAEAQTRAWEALKARERQASGSASSLLDGIPLGLPALTRASKLGKRAASAGFDWPDAQGARDKVSEELNELDRACGEPRARERIAAEIGDLLFAVVNLARHHGVDPEAALRGTNARFAGRFQYIEMRVRESGRRFQDVGLAALERLWQEAKKVDSDQ